MLPAKITSTNWNGSDQPNPNTRFRRPPAAKNVTARVTGVGQVTVRWQDYNPTDPWDINEDFAWYIRYCPAAVAGVQDAHWTLSVLQRSKVIGVMGAVGSGQYFTITYHEDNIPDGYIMVRGESTSMQGEPSTPIFVQLGDDNTDTTPDVSSINVLDVTVEKERVPYDVLKLDFFYIAPFNKKDFAGVHVHMVGYNGVSVPVEIGQMAHWDKSSGLLTHTHRLAIEGGLGSGTATFTNGSPNVVRLTGTNFNGAWVNRQILIDMSSTEAHAERTIASFTDANHIAMNADFIGVTGTYTWKVLNQTTFYVVPIGLNGSRGDYSAAGSAAI